MELQLSRLEKGISLEELAILTMIPKRLLEAIELGNLSQLPEPIYTQALIRLSADALALDSMRLANYFPTNVDLAISESVNQRLITNNLDTVHLYLVYIGFIFCTVSGLSQSFSDSSLQAQNIPLAQTIYVYYQDNKRSSLDSHNQQTHGESMQISLTGKEKS